MLPLIRLATLLLLLSLIAGCSSDDGAADLIPGTWFWESQGAYERLAEDGTWSVWLNADLVGDAHGWGTYTFDGETLVYYNAEGSYCSGAVASWTVEFSDDGQESTQTFVEDSCTASGVTRG
jgi:hypothetical protein